MATKKVWYAPYKFEAYGEEEIQAVTASLRAGWLAPGPLTDEFEQKVAAIFGKKNGVMVNSGSSANIIALVVAGVGPGTEVITSALSFATVLAPVAQLGATPVFVDAEDRCYVSAATDVKPVLDKLTPKTKAIFLPNLVGAKPNWKALREGLKGTPYEHVLLIEDSCDTLTHTPESDIAVTSFYASHVITAGGGGGMVMFNSEEQKKKALMYRDWGRIGTNSEDPSVRFEYNVDGIEYDFKFLYGVKGWNMKSTEMNAAFGLEQLKKLDKFFAIRRRNHARYLERLKDCPFVTLPLEREPYNWLAMPFMTPHRGKLLRYLEEHDVQTRVCFAGNITRHPAFREYFGEYPIADKVMKDGFLLGAHHGLSEEDIDRVCDLILAFKP
jgi:CDP-6-deoxy-D-xylo-4-hexulose-3-dehydrase